METYNIDYLNEPDGVSAPSVKKGFWYYVSVLLSYAFHPVFIPSYLFALLLFFAELVFHPLSNVASFNVVVIIFVTTAIIPLVMLSVLFFFNKKRMSRSALFMHNSEDRFIPFLYVGCFYSGLTYILYDSLHLPPMLIFYMSIISLSVLLVAFISLFWKISAHSLALGASLMMMVFTYSILPESRLFNSALVALVVSGAVMSARLYLNAHTPSQVYGGFIAGLTLGGCGYLVILYSLSL